MYDWLGYIGGFFYVLCYLPQIMELYCKNVLYLVNPLLQDNSKVLTAKVQGLLRRFSYLPFLL